MGSRWSAAASHTSAPGAGDPRSPAEAEPGAARTKARGGKGPGTGERSIPRPGACSAAPPPRAARGPPPGDRGSDPMRGSCHSCCRGSRAAQPTVRPASLRCVRRPGSECAGFRRGGGAATPLSPRGRRPRPDAPLVPGRGSPRRRPHSAPR